jgi:isoleucyl-tRNA synthetase
MGNVIDSQEVIDKYGAEILRLWVVSEDYTDDIRISDEILKRLVEAYRRIRNTSRYILGNLYDFNCDADMVSYHEMEEMDRWALHRLQEIVRRVRDAYSRYQFHIVYYTLYNFCTVDLSALYLDVLKDRIYTSKAASSRRRSAQTAMHVILDAMARLLAPMLTFTAEEIWKSLPDYKGKADSVHLTLFPEGNPLYLNQSLADEWKTMIAIRSEVAKAIEIARKNKIIGHSLDVSVDIALPEKLRSLLECHLEDMRALLIVSQIQLVEKSELKEPFQSVEIDGLFVEVTRARGRKCSRCWVFDESVGKDKTHPDICEKCLLNL